MRTRIAYESVKQLADGWHEAKRRKSQQERNSP
jgi:hypothetical protein